jgi:EmrB/QacA subfamily drug resistance transporter
LILASLLLAAFAINVDTTIVNVALPTLVSELHATTSQLQWIVDAYNLVFAALVLAAGSVSDRVGRKGMLLTGLGIFALASVAGGLSSSPEALIVARCFMGLGAAVIFPATLSLIANVFVERRERARAIGLWGATAGLGVAFGPITGGFLLEHFNWPSIFFALAPVAGVTAALAAVTVPTSRDPQAPRADVPGLALSSGAMALLIFTIIEAPAHGWGSARTVAGFAAAVVLLGSFVAWEHRSREPMIDLGLFRNLRFTAASGSVTIAFFSLSGFIFLVTQYFQFLKGYSPLSTGVRLLPVAVSVAVTSVVGTRLAVRFGTKQVVVGGLLSLAAGLAWTASASTSTSYLEIVGQMVLLGSGIGLTSAPATEAIMGVVPKEKAGIGSAVNDASRVLGATLGVAVIGSVYASLYASRLSARLPAALPPTLARAAHNSVGAALTIAERLARTPLSGLSATVHDAASGAFFHGFGAGVLVAAAVTVAGAMIAGLLLPAQPAAVEPPGGERGPDSEPMVISILTCIAGCESAGAAALHHQAANGRVQALQRFYASMFDWNAVPFGDGHAIIAAPEGARVISASDVGVVPGLHGAEAAVYVQVANLGTLLGKVQSLGGRKLLGPIDSPDGQKLALLADPEGQLIGLLEPAPDRRV